MRGTLAAENGHKIDVVKSAKFVADNIETLVLHILHGQMAVSKHEIISAIFIRQGVSVNPNRMDIVLGSLGEEGLIEKTKRGLLTAYTLTDKGKKTAEQAKTDDFIKL